VHEAPHLARVRGGSSLYTAYPLLAKRLFPQLEPVNFHEGATLPLLPRLTLFYFYFTFIEKAVDEKTKPKLKKKRAMVLLPSYRTKM